MGDPGREVTLLLAEMRIGHEDVLAKPMPLVYGELRPPAGHYLRGEHAGPILQPMALVHEAFSRLVGKERAGWGHHGQLIGAAAQMMRRILVVRARQRAAGKRTVAAVTVNEETLGPALRAQLAERGAA